MRHVFDVFILRPRVYLRFALLYTATAANRFGGNVEWVHCINMMPFTPISEELLPYDYVQQEWPVLAIAFDR
jgi:hypothetical protein